MKKQKEYLEKLQDDKKLLEKQCKNLWIFFQQETVIVLQKRMIKR